MRVQTKAEGARHNFLEVVTKHDISIKPESDGKMNIADPNRSPYYSAEQYPPNHYRHAYPSGVMPQPQQPVNQPSGQPPYQNGGAYYSNHMYPQQPVPQIHHNRPQASNIQDPRNPMTPHRSTYPPGSQYINPSDVSQESPYRGQNEQPPMHYPSTQNTNNNHMVNQAHMPQFHSPKLNSSLPPNSPMVSGQCRNGPWPNNGQYGSVFQQSANESMQSPSSFGENQSVSSSVDSEASVPQQTSNKRAYPCPKCSKVFKRGDHLKRHLLSVHDREHPYQCGECSKGFASITTLTRHCQASHPGISSKSHLCVRCGIRYRNLTEIESHASSLHAMQDAEYMKNINRSSKTFQCEICHKTVSSEKNLKRHIKKLHGENARNILSCGICEQSFISNEGLKEHMARSHASSSVVPTTANTTAVVAEPHVNQAHLASQKDNSQLHSALQFAPKTVADDSTMHRMNTEKLLQNPSDPKAMHLTQPMYQPHAVPGVQAIESMKALVTRPPLAYQQAPAGGQVSSTVMPLAPVNSYPSAERQTLTAPNSELSQLSTSQTEMKETSSVSEAFSMAMKTLSEFSYEDFPFTSGEYIPTSLSVFQSNLPMPNFHYPSAVQVSTSTQGPKSVLTPSTVSQSVFVAGPAVPFSEIASDPLKQDPQGQPVAQTLHQDENGSAGMQYPQTNDAAALARRGRPKKKKSPFANGDSEELSTNGMIVKTDANEDNGRFTCTVCHEIYQGIDNLMQHVESVHLSANPHECCICNKRFAQAGNVKRHIRFVHLRERPFQCRDCDSTFDRLCYLQRHMRSHVDSKVQNPDTAHLNPCNCPECGKRCLTAHHLRGHMQRKHFAKNNKHSEKMVHKYSHLFQGPSGFNKGILSAKSFDEFGRPVTSKEHKKRPKENCGHQTSFSYTNYNGMYTTQPTNITDCGVTSITSVHDNNLSNNMGSAKTFMRNQSAEESSQPNTTLNISQQTFKEGSSQLEQLLSETQNSHVISGKKKPQLLDRSRMSNSRKSYKLYNVNCSFGKLKRRLLRYKCQHCPGRQFSSMRLLKSHIAVVHHSTQRRHLCLLCGHSFSSNLLLMAHVSKRHNTRPKRAAASRQKHTGYFAKTAVFQNSPILQEGQRMHSKEIGDQCSSDMIPQVFDKEQTFQSNLLDSVVNLPTHSLVHS